MKTLLISLFFSVTALQGAITINYGNPGVGDVFLRDKDGQVLPGITKGGEANAIVQLGYYSASTMENPFAGEWVALTGEGSSVVAPAIGQGVSGLLGEGRFSGTVTFESAHPGGVPFPSSGTLLSIRFYDGASVAESSYYNAVTLPDWGWINSGTLDLAIFPSPDNIMIWEGGSGSAYRTTIPVPEPSAIILALAAGSGFLVKRRRSEKLSACELLGW